MLKFPKAHWYKDRKISFTADSAGLWLLEQNDWVPFHETRESGLKMSPSVALRTEPVKPEDEQVTEISIKVKVHPDQDFI